MDTKDEKIEDIEVEDVPEDTSIDIQELLEKESEDSFIRKWTNLIIQNTEQYWNDWVQGEEKAYKKLDPESFHRKWFYQNKTATEKNMEALKKHKEEIAKVIKTSLRKAYESYKYEGDNDAMEWLKNHVSLDLIKNAHIERLWLGNDTFTIEFRDEGFFVPNKPKFTEWKDEYKPLYRKLMQAMDQGQSIEEFMKNFNLKIIDIYVNAGFI